MPDKKDFGYSFPATAPAVAAPCDSQPGTPFYLFGFLLAPQYRRWSPSYWHWEASHRHLQGKRGLSQTNQAPIEWAGSTRLTSAQQLPADQRYNPFGTQNTLVCLGPGFFLLFGHAGLATGIHVSLTPGGQRKELIARHPSGRTSAHARQWLAGVTSGLPSRSFKARVVGLRTSTVGYILTYGAFPDRLYIREVRLTPHST